ncbi:hypothetical protein SDC9_78632 [bioreactor metagenome]|uniref:Uncharacterized protein n=1 Tax=bioreactor metagenome TaxID=1076179 RepID=A0A644Z008_9ZZZZ
MQGPNFIQIPVVALHDNAVDSPAGDTDLGVPGQHIPHKSRHAGADRQGVCDDDGCFDRAEFFNLNKSRRLAKSVDDMTGSRNLIPKKIAPMGQDSRYTGAGGPLGQGDLAHRNTRYIGDEISLSSFQLRHVKLRVFLCIYAHRSGLQILIICYCITGWAVLQ